MMPKRIAVISYHTCPLSDEEGKEVGGMNVYVLELSKELAKKGLVLDLFTRSQDEKSPKIVNVSNNLRVIHIPAGPQTSLSKKEIADFIPEFLTNFYAFIKSEKAQYDIVSCHYYLSGIIGIDIKKKLQIPMTITFHTLALMKNLVARSEDEKEDVERIRYELLLVKEADIVIATSENDAQYLETLYDCPSEKIVVLMPGVNLNLFKPNDKIIAKKKINADPDHEIILFVGRIEPLKGIDIIIYAIKILLEKNPNLRVCLWIVGGNSGEQQHNWSEELKKLEEIRKILQIATAVKFVGRKHQSELPDYYNAAKIAVMPSHYESFGITALEAMACGVPLITTDVTGISDLFDKKHHAMITSANNPLLLAEKMKNLLVDKNVYDRASKEVYRKVQDLSWENVAANFVKICSECKTNDF
jgi:D-inositol-3-phosphate glycosyltransferase